MSRKKGGLGNAVAPEQPEDLLDSVFGMTTPKQETRDTPPRPSRAKGKRTTEDKPERVGKYFLIDKELAKAMKLYAVENDMKEITVIEAALRTFLGKKAKQS